VRARLARNGGEGLGLPGVQLASKAWREPFADVAAALAMSLLEPVPRRASTTQRLPPTPGGRRRQAGQPGKRATRFIVLHFDVCQPLAAAEPRVSERASMLRGLGSAFKDNGRTVSSHQRSEVAARCRSLCSKAKVLAYGGRGVDVDVDVTVP